MLLMTVVLEEIACDMPTQIVSKSIDVVRAGRINGTEEGMADSASSRRHRRGAVFKDGRPAEDV